MKFENYLKQQLNEAEIYVPSNQRIIEVSNDLTQFLNFNALWDGKDILKLIKSSSKNNEESTTFKVFTKRQFSPKLFGPFVACIKSLEVSAVVIFDDRYIVLSLDYSWEYISGGRNGVDVRYIHKNGKWGV